MYYRQLLFPVLLVVIGCIAALFFKAPAVSVATPYTPPEKESSTQGISELLANSYETRIKDLERQNARGSGDPALATKRQKEIEVLKKKAAEARGQQAQ